MRASTLLTALIGGVLGLSLAPPLAAQEPDTAFVYASYWRCGGDFSDAVATIRDDWAPLMQRRVDAGDVAAWGLLTHDTGNDWSLAIYHIGPDYNALKAALDETQQEYFEANQEAAQGFGEACPSHEDYVWMTGAGSEPGGAVAQQRSGTGMSVYYVCDEGREAVADLIVDRVWAPVLDRQVSEGKLGSWVWLSHFLGGKYRKALVTDGADAATLLEARDEFIEATAENGALGAAFSDVCNGHQDIIWNIAVSRP